MQIIKRNRETREYNMVDLFAEVGALSTAMSEKIQEINDKLHNLFNRIVQAILESFKELLNITPANYVITVAIHYPLVICVKDIKHIIINFLEHASKVRKIFLITKHHRGSTDDTAFSFSM